MNTFAAIGDSQLRHSGDQVMFRPGEGPEQPAFSAILELWNTKKGDREMPTRGDISARDMKNYLRHVQLYEVAENSKDFLIRLIGTDFTESMGYDPTGSYVSQLADPFLRERTYSAAMRVLEGRSPICTSATFQAAARIVYRRIEKVWLPLGSDGAVTHILCQARRVDRAEVSPSGVLSELSY